MKLSHLAAMAWVVFCVLICGCGDVFRPVATPLPQPSPDPQSFRLAVFTSCVYDASISTCSRNSSGPAGAASDANVSGDSLEGVVTVGRSPVAALVEPGAFVRVTTADRDSDTVTIHTDSILTSPHSISAPSTIALPAGAAPVSLAVATGTIYVAESGRNVVGVLSGTSTALSTEIPVGTTPVNLAVLPNSKKVYVVNQGSTSVSVISTADNGVLATISVGSSPVWAVPSADSNRVYVVNQGSNNVSIIDATSDSVIGTVTVGASPNYAVFDAKNQRVVVTNPSSNSVSVINADPTSPAFKNVTTVAVGSTPISVTVLADGTRLYVANTGSNSVSVINSLSLAVMKTVSLASSATSNPLDVSPSPVWIASDSQSLKVYTANRDSRNVSVINTLTDSELTDAAGRPNRLLAPQVDPSCTGTSCARLNPVFIAVGG